MIQELHVVHTMYLLYYSYKYTYEYLYLHARTRTDRARTRTDVHGQWPVRATDSTDAHGHWLVRATDSTDVPRTFPVAQIKGIRIWTAPQPRDHLYQKMAIFSVPLTENSQSFPISSANSWIEGKTTY